MGLIKNELRLPLVPLSKPYHDQLRKYISGLRLKAEGVKPNSIVNG
jgi:hypothetical protein